MTLRQGAWGDSKIIPIAGCFIFNHSGHLLLLRRHRKSLGGGQWGTPAGRIEFGESQTEAMLREIFEETGLKLDQAKYLGDHLIKMPHGTVRMASFHTTVPDDTVITIDPGEHEEFAWFDPKKLLHQEDLLWGEPTMLRDFGLIEPFDDDPTLADGSTAILLEKS
jgi:8-oxo-dGTP diphosphatase